MREVSIIFFPHIKVAISNISVVIDLEAPIATGGASMWFNHTMPGAAKQTVVLLISRSCSNCPFPIILPASVIRFIAAHSMSMWTAEQRERRWLPETLEVCAACPPAAALHLIAHCDCSLLTHDPLVIFLIDLLSKLPKVTAVFFCRCIFDERWR